jgi:hypothetical protein
VPLPPNTISRFSARLVLGAAGRTDTDMVLQEDDHQPCSANASALQVTAWLRTLAYNLLAAWRTRQPLKDGLPIRWERACEKLRDALVHGPTEACLPTGA